MMRSRKRALTATIVVAVIGLIIAVSLWLFPERVQKVGSLFSAESIELLVDFLRSLGWIGPLVSVGLMVLQSIIAPLPSFVIAAANGMVYGVFWGAVISWIGGMAGALLSFWLARTLGYEVVQKWMKKTTKLGRIDQISGKNGFTVILIARLIPIVSFDAISLLAGLSSIRLGVFLAATGIGQIPGTLLYVILGHDLIHIGEYQNRLWIVAGILIGLILIVKKVSKLRNRNQLKEAEDMNGIKELQTTGQWQVLLEASITEPVLVFKHSTACPISAQAWEEVQHFVKNANTEHLETAMVKVIEFRSISNQIADDTGVKHASPQILFIRQKKVCWHTSHEDITAFNISKGIRQYD
jgi:bacillithiol system protein YtxJ